MAEAQLSGNHALASELLSAPTFGLAMVNDRDSDLAPLLRWCTVGRSPGRGSQTTFADDLVLSGLAEVLRLAARFTIAEDTHEARGVTLSAALTRAAECMRECAAGQFLSTFQGADAMQALKPKGHGNSYRKSKKLTTIANVLLSQVKPQLESAARGEIELEAFGSRQILRVIDGEKERRVSILPPKAEDWKLLAMARTMRHGDPHKAAWQAFALMVVCCADIECGWFEQYSKRKGGKTPRYLALSEQAHTALLQDMDHWLHAGMMEEPMVVPPEDGGYLTVKRKAVTSRKSIRGLETKAEGSTAWANAGRVMASCPWTVNKMLLEALDARPDLVERSEPDELKRRLVVASYKRLATAEFYLPLYMDFRGRVYTRPSAVTYQGSDLQKALLCFPDNGREALNWYDPRTMHLAALAGLDKRPLSDRQAWTRSLGDVMGDVNRRRWDGAHISKLLDKAFADDAEPMQLLGGLILESRGADRLAVQIDGTCNGLQHLTALFRDEQAAPLVNLSRSTPEDHPADLYQAVANEAALRVGYVREPWAFRVRDAINVASRKLTKSPVMVLPYGGTRTTIEEKIFESALKQKPNPKAWLDCTVPFFDGQHEMDEVAVAGGYLAFADRDLEKHPLFRRDMQKLGGLVWDCITAKIPKAMAAMEAFREIARRVGDRNIRWCVDWNESPLWVSMCKDKVTSGKMRLKGFHLPESVRQVAMLKPTGEIAKGETVAGIGANFIHSQDAAHLSDTMALYHAAGGRSFGAIHDCLLSRPSEAHLLAAAVRQAFVMRYTRDPLTLPVEVRAPKEPAGAFYPSWYALAAELGVSFPERGSWDPNEVLESAWFFS